MPTELGDDGGVVTFTQAQVDTILAEQLSGLKAKNEDLLGETKRAKTALRDYDGVDLKEFKRLKEAADVAERAKASAEGDFKSLEKQLIDRHTAELVGRDARISKLTSSLEKKLLDAELIRAITAKKGEPDLLLPFARQFARVREVDDGFEGFVADASGNPMVADGKGTAMTFEMFVEQQLMTKFPRAFEGSGSSGGGAPAKSAARGGGGPKTIPVGDNNAFISNLADIAAGKMTVE